MTMEKKNFRQLLDKYLSGEATDFEKQLLDAYYERLSIPVDPFSSAGEENAIKSEILMGVKRRIYAAPVVPLIKRPWVRLAAAAVFVGLLGAGYFWFAGQKRHAESQEIASNKLKAIDIPPSRNGAILKLANGASILLDTMQNGTVITQGNLRITKDEGKIRYEPVKGGPSEFANLTNTISTPKSRKWTLQLPDGSIVWLNSESAITYPLTFNGKERLVEMNGEAYFQVIHNDRVPFRVKAGNVLIEDVGTAFNVQAYEDNKTLKATLVEGSVKVWSAKTGKEGATNLKPGQQIEANSAGILRLNDQVKVDEVIAWKDGKFKFSEGTIDEVMSAAARWYGIDITYEGVIKDHFVLNVSRDLPLSALLEIMESTGRVRFEVNGNHVKAIAVQLPE